MARTRSIEAHGKVIHAALTLFCERGIEATSMDAIARCSGVSKATIYNHWADKEALLMEVMLHVNGADRRPGHVETGDLRLDLITVLNWQPPGDLETARARITPMFMAYAAVHREFGAAWRHRVMEPGRNALMRSLSRGIERGLLPPGLNLDLAIALLMGPMLYQHVFSKGAAAKLENIGQGVADAFCRAHLIGSATADKPAKSRKKISRA
ncbi:MAG TPA: TetR/AcrR family transcriptional regulator [Terracidiphilus sp.]|jgi:AcrR family transcriptional regulator|nr:TetR/AcrR family transcriptional regulator [Terracidiphilus sp.]